MYNSIIDFTENDTTKIRKILEKYPFSGNVLRFEEDLMRVLIEFGRKIYQEYHVLYMSYPHFPYHIQRDRFKFCVNTKTGVFQILGHSLYVHHYSFPSAASRSVMICRIGRCASSLYNSLFFL